MAKTDGKGEGRRDSILRAAAALLEVEDYPDITMERVARKAGVAKGTPYLYFPTKEKLFTALAETMRADARAAFQRTWDESAPGLERLKAFVREQLAFFEGHSGLFLQMLRGNIPTLCPGRDQGCAEMVNLNIDYMARALAEAARLGQARRVDARSAATALFGMVRGFVIARMVGSAKGPLMKSFDRIWDVFCKGVAA